MSYQSFFSQLILLGVDPLRSRHHVGVSEHQQRVLCQNTQIIKNRATRKNAATAADATKFCLHFGDQRALPAAPQTSGLRPQISPYSSLSPRTRSFQDGIRFLQLSTPNPSQILQLLRAKSASSPISPRPDSFRHDASLFCGRLLSHSCYPVQFLPDSHWCCCGVLRRLRFSQCCIRVTNGLDSPSWRGKRKCF